MTLKQTLFEGTPGENLTTANTGASIVSKNGGTAVFSTSAKQSGATGALLTTSATATPCMLRFPTPANKNQALTVVLTMPTVTSSAEVAAIASLRHTGDGVVINAGQTSTNVLGIYTAGDSQQHYFTPDGSLTTNKADPKNLVVVPGNKYRLEIVASGGSTTAGSYTAKVYTATGTTPLGSITRTGINMNANLMNAYEVGVSNGGHAGISVGVDDLQSDDGRTTPIPQITAALSAPNLTVTSTNPTVAGGKDGTITVTAGPSVGAAGIEVGVMPGDVTSGEPDTFMTIPGASGGSRTFTGFAAGVYTGTAIAK